jgi:hypothetical protein
MNRPKNAMFLKNGNDPLKRMSHERMSKERMTKERKKE